MKCRLILPVGLLTCFVCLGGVNASEFELLRLVGEQAAVEAPLPVAEPDPIEEDGKFEAEQKGCGEVVCEPRCRPNPLRDCAARIRCATMNFHARVGAGCESLKARLCVPQCCPPATCCEPACGFEAKGEVACQKDCGPVSQKGCESFTLPCRPRLWGWGRTSCEPACGIEAKGEVACQKDCGPVSQKGCESFALPCRPRLWGWGRSCCEPACGIETKGEVACQKDCGPVSQKGCESSTLPCRPRLRGWGRNCCELPTCAETTVQKGGCTGVEQKEFDMSKDQEVQKET